MSHDDDAADRGAPDATTADAVRLLDQIIEHMPAMVFMKDARDLRFERFNRAGEELLGIARAQMLGKTDHDFFPPEQADFFVEKDREVLRGKQLLEIPEEPIQTPRGTRWLHTRKIPLLDAHGEPQHLLGISVDITERRRAERMLRSSHLDLERAVVTRTEELQRESSERTRAELRAAKAEDQLRHAQKMEALGRLAGGIAHDFNNLLSVVISYCDLVLLRLPSDLRTRREVEEIRSAGQRAAELTRQLLAFSRQQVLQPKTLDLNEVVRGMERMLTRLLGEDILFEIRARPGLHKVKADPSQLEQVVMNLVLNARDAMPTGGQLVIETDNLDVHPTAHDGSPQPQVLLMVSDTGGGMSRETLSRAFEPFFTTKELGKGTGLGLSTVFGIVTQSGGTVRAESEPGCGTTFYVSFPACEAAESIEAGGGAVSANSARGTETILLVEDDARVRVLAAEVLRVYGYDVISASVPSEAIARAAEHPGPIHLVLTDVVMPEMSGPSLAEHLTEALPSLRVLFMSGYADDSRLRHGVADGMPFLHKPFSPEQLARSVRSALDAPPPALRSETRDEGKPSRHP